MSAAKDLRDLTILIAAHHRLDPMTSKDRCTCGHITALGKFYTEHIAREAIRQGWRKA